VATEKEANLARERHAEKLRSLGAHAITVEEFPRGEKRTFGVVAMFEEKPRGVPKTLDVEVGKKTVAVPLRVAKAERFRPE
jgi:hypothetical protein